MLNFEMITMRKINSFNVNSDKNICHKRLGDINRNSLKIWVPYCHEICKACIEHESAQKTFYKCIRKSVEIGEGNTNF